MWESKKSFWSLGSEKARLLCERLEAAGLDIACMRNRQPIPGKSWDWKIANQILEDVIAGRESALKPKPKKAARTKKVAVTEEPKEEKKVTKGRKRKPRRKAK